MLTVAQIWRYPVKSMGGEQLTEADVNDNGIVWDRGWAVHDENDGTLCGGREIPKILMCTARYLPGTSAGRVPHVEIVLPDGSSIRSDDADVDTTLSTALGRQLKLRSFTPSDKANPASPPPSYEELMTPAMQGRLRALFGLEKNEPLPDESVMRAMMDRKPSQTGYFDAFPIDVLTTSSLRHLQRLLPDANLDVRRFRPNFLIDDAGASDGIRERDWVGRAVTIGKARLDVVMECPRCIMVAAEQPGGITRNTSITRALVREMHQSISAYCSVAHGGKVRLGDQLAVI